MIKISALLQFSILGNPLQQWLGAALICLGTWLIISLSKRIIVEKISHFAKKTETILDDLAGELLDNTKSLLIAIFSIWAGAKVLFLPEAASHLLHTLVVFALFLQLALWGNRAVGFWISYKMNQQDEDDPASLSAYGAIGFVARLVLWSLVALLALDNLGVDITTLVAGLGVGSVAIALAVQNILGDVFCSFSIILDKPFEVGDFIVLGDKSGVVERIGIKSTRIRSLQGEQIVVSNADLVGSRIQNFKRMQERRVLFTIGVVYQTSAEKMAAIPQIIQQIIEPLELARFDRAHFKTFGPYSLDFEIVYYVLSREYIDYMNTQQTINLEILKKFTSEGIEFAYPTQSLFLEKTA